MCSKGKALCFLFLFGTVKFGKIIWFWFVSCVVWNEGKTCCFLFLSCVLGWKKHVFLLCSMTRNHIFSCSRKENMYFLLSSLCSRKKKHAFPFLFLCNLKSGKTCFLFVSLLCSKGEHLCFFFHFGELQHVETKNTFFLFALLGSRKKKPTTSVSFFFVMWWKTCFFIFYVVGRKCMHVFSCFFFVQ